MNAVVAIGGPALFRVVDRFRAHVPSSVWVLGLKTPRDSNDPHLRSLEALIEPFLEPYFAAEAQVRMTGFADRLTADPIEFPAVDAVDAVRLRGETMTILERGLAAAMALVEMLDRANASERVELVFIDNSSDSARTAAVWARSRKIPLANIPDRMPLQRAPERRVNRTLVIGERARMAYAAGGASEPVVVALPGIGSAKWAIPVDVRATGRNDARVAFTRALGWGPADVVIVFEPTGLWRETALEPADAFATSLVSMFAGFAHARASMPTLRLAVVTRPSAEGVAQAGMIAAAAGLTTSDFAYAQADHEAWLAGADIVVSVDSTRSLEAACLGLPAVNLRVPASWYRGPAFDAEDGIIDANPDALGPTLVALATDLELRRQIAHIAGDRLAGESPTSAAAATAFATRLITDHSPAVRIELKPKLDIVIWAPDYNHASGGIRALYRLCHLINLAGGNASMYPPVQLHPSWNTPARNTPITERTIVVIPEIVVAHPSLKRVVRWVLNVPGLLGGPKTYEPGEMVFYYSQYFRAAAQSATEQVLTDERELMVHTIEPELFYDDRSRPRLYDCVYIGKGQAIYDRVQPREIRDAFIIQRAAIVWPANRNETAAMLRGCRRLYSFDAVTALVHEGIICGAEVLFVEDDGSLRKAEYDMSAYAPNYYDLTHVERFLAYVTQEWE